jgi:hypothetical protein
MATSKSGSFASARPASTMSSNLNQHFTKFDATVQAMLPSATVVLSELKSLYLLLFNLEQAKAKSTEFDRFCARCKRQISIVETSVY